MVPREEPPNRQLTGEPLRWKHRLVFGLAIGLPFYLCQQLEGVRWDCPRCKRQQTVRLRFTWNNGDGYYFHCRCRNKVARFADWDAQALNELLGVSGKTPPVVQAVGAIARVRRDSDTD